MDKTLQTIDNSLSSLIEGTTEKGAKLVDFLYQQAPEVINQLLTWKAVESFIYFISSCFLIFVCPFLVYKIVIKWQNYIQNSKKVTEKSKMELKWIPSIILGFFSLLTTQIIGWNNINLDWLKIWLAPKMFLLEYITDKI